MEINRIGKKILTYVVYTIVLITFCVKETRAIANPASLFCHDNGGRLEIREVTGGQDGYCIFPDGNECNEWQYFRKCTNKEKNQCQQPCRQITTTPKILPTKTPTPKIKNYFPSFFNWLKQLLRIK